MVKNFPLLVAISSAVLFGCEPQKQPQAEVEPEQVPAVGFPAAKNRTASAAVQTGLQTYVCTQQVAAYDPANPSQQLGFFKTGSELQLTLTPTGPGMVVVTYQDPSGTLITAVCRAEDVGVAPPGQSASAPSQEPQKPKGLSGGVKTQGNPKYKPLGGGL